MSEGADCGHTRIFKQTRPEGKNDVEVDHWVCNGCGLEWTPPWLAEQA